MRVSISRVSVAGILFLICNICVADQAQDIQCLRQSYPIFLSPNDYVDKVVSTHGDEFLYDEHISSKLTQAEDLIDRADLKTQMALKYPLGSNLEVPPKNFDPGRFRSQHFFQKMYGESKLEVFKQLTSVFWAPCNCVVQFTAKNLANQKLERIGKLISEDNEIKDYLSKPLGSFNWRKIQGTNRYSMHAYGAAIDFYLPKGLSKYWKWSGCKDGDDCIFPQQILSDKKLQKIVKIFEANGFIWGGRWYHFDSVHFEYRPELVNLDCK